MIENKFPESNHKKEKKEVKTKNEERLSWGNVEKCLAENSTSGNALAIIETEKIFSKILNKSDFPGKDINQKILNLKSIISNHKELLRVRKIYTKLIESTSPGFDLENLDIRKILAIYYKAIENINNFNQAEGNLLKKIKIRLNYFYFLLKSNLKKVSIGTLIFFFLIFILDSTKIGNNIVTLFTAISHFIFSWILFTVLLIGGIIIIIVGSIFYFESRKKKKQLRIED